MSEDKPENVEEESSNEDIKSERSNLKKLGLEKMSESSFNILFDENSKEKRKKTQNKKPFRGFV